MQDFYHPERLNNGADSVPHILGLTASPGSDPEEMRLVFFFFFSFFFFFFGKRPSE